MPKERVYDGEKLFKAWCGWGAAASNPRLMEFAKSQFGSTSQMGPNYAMWHWAFHHPEEAFELYKEWWFDTYPDKEPITFQDFLITLQQKGVNKNIGSGVRSLERFCAKYGLEMDFQIEPGDIIQVTRSSNPSYQWLYVVEKVSGEEVLAYSINDKSYSKHSFSIRDVGVCGKVII